MSATISQTTTTTLCNGISNGKMVTASTASNGSDLVDQMSNVSSNGSSNGISSAGSKMSKVSKIGRRIKESCKNLSRGKHPSGGASSNPDDYTPCEARHDSTRSTHFVPMDFSGKQGRIVNGKDTAGRPTKDGYTYWRRKMEPTNVDHLLTETQANIHKEMPWFHKGVSREVAQRILASHCVDGLFLMRESSIAGNFVISYFFGKKVYHVAIRPITAASGDIVTYSLENDAVRFFDLLQLVEFYQLNQGSLNSRLTNYVICNTSASRRSDSPTDSASSSSCRNASDASLDSAKDILSAGSNPGAATNGSLNNNVSNGKTASAKNSEESGETSDDGEISVATAVDATMVSEDEEKDPEADASMREAN